MKKKISDFLVSWAFIQATVFSTCAIVTLALCVNHLDTYISLCLYFCIGLLSSAIPFLVGLAMTD